VRPVRGHTRKRSAKLARRRNAKNKVGDRTNPAFLLLRLSPSGGAPPFFAFVVFPNRRLRVVVPPSLARPSPQFSQASGSLFPALHSIIKTASLSPSSARQFGKHRRPGHALDPPGQSFLVVFANGRSGPDFDILINSFYSLLSLLNSYKINSIMYLSIH
jgi:hypothetical protein